MISIFDNKNNKHINFIEIVIILRFETSYSYLVKNSVKKKIYKILKSSVKLLIYFIFYNMHL